MLQVVNMISHVSHFTDHFQSCFKFSGGWWLCDFSVLKTGHPGQKLEDLQVLGKCCLISTNSRGVCFLECSTGEEYTVIAA